MRDRWHDTLLKLKTLSKGDEVVMISRKRNYGKMKILIYIPIILMFTASNPFLLATEQDRKFGNMGLRRLRGSQKITTTAVERREMDADGAKDEFYYLFETAPSDWSADQWGFFASLMTFGVVAFCFCCCMIIPMCCSGCACLQDILLTLFCIEVCCDTSPRYSGFFC